MNLQNLPLTEYPPGDLRFKPVPCAWYDIKYIYKSIGWYVVVNDRMGIHTPRPYMTFLDYGQQAYWDGVIENHPHVQFMIVTFPEKEEKDE